MKRFKDLVAVFAIFAAVILGVTDSADAQKRNDREVRDIVRSLNSKLDDFSYALDYRLKSSSADDSEIQDIMQSVDGLKSSITAFDENLAQRRENRDDVNELIDSAKQIDSMLISSPQPQAIQSNWNSIRDLIGRLASNYSITPDWNAPAGRNGTYRTTSQSAPAPDYKPSRSSTPTFGNSGRNNSTYGSNASYGSSRLTGTYQIDTARSENTADIITRTNVGDNDRDDLESKLEAPEQIAIDVRGDQITLASSKASPITFSADGREKVDTSSGRTVRLKATLRGDELTVSSLGGESDFTIIFTPDTDGRTMKVTRRITTEYLSETVFAESVYNRTDATARLGVDTSVPTNVDDGNYSSNDPNDRPVYSSNGGRSNGGSPVISSGRTGTFAVPNGTIITGVLENEIDTNVSQNNDRFRLTVQSPDEFRGAVVEGYLTGVGRSGQVSGRSNVTFNFETITMRDGKRYDFAGSLQSIKDQYGKEVKVDSEGTARGNSQTKETAKRGGVGAGLGAVIGAIAGGGKGALIGAIIGGGAGAGSVAIQGRDDIHLMKGAVITVQSSSPVRNSPPAVN